MGKKIIFWRGKKYDFLEGKKMISEQNIHPWVLLDPFVSTDHYSYLECSSWAHVCRDHYLYPGWSYWSHVYVRTTIYTRGGPLGPMSKDHYLYLEWSFWSHVYVSNTIYIYLGWSRMPVRTTIYTSGGPPGPICLQGPLSIPGVVLLVPYVCKDRGRSWSRADTSVPSCLRSSLLHIASVIRLNIL